MYRVKCDFSCNCKDKINKDNPRYEIFAINTIVLRKKKVWRIKIITIYLHRKHTKKTQGNRRISTERILK